MGIFDMTQHINKSSQVKEHKFPDTQDGMRRAKLLQSKMKRDYGFKPEILRVSKKGNSFLIIVQHKSMIKLR